jgi:amino acid transporter
MGKIKKFGTFGGVFTPSILTILGVIMYLRFPVIIGQAGLINTIGIIVIAHIISITTSLSVASLSTDKPVKNGGTYFMISRSLGLPIGGTLGLALFVGLSFSVSLYLIGFSESFLQYWGLTNNIQTIRITGTIVLMAVTTITFISTSLAIKSQYFIMAAIGLSLLSIFLGNHDFTPSEVHLTPIATAAPFMVLFGIFFPAVTGFEAGVSMSGDLKNPSKSLPVGAMMAVGIGFVVYIGLALFYSYTVDADALVNDPQILFKISLVPGLVIAGIWGATLSSALGSILGAPRILQAIAMDKIAPKALGKGTGKTNEPRNALLLTFVIAEIGILIGELDVIARIVSMFFITTYGFLNLASVIESWSSSDFRPAFRIPRFVSVLGALAAFIVMILLDFIALAGATVVLGMLYFFLQRKELILESGDAWSSFWMNMAKQALLKLSAKRDNSRNWRPNIVLFSGGEKVRPHLVELGLDLSGKLGALTDFNLRVDANAVRPLPREYEKKGQKARYFLRDLPCHSVEEGISTVTSVYGFSGFEPNTVLMGWSKQVGNKDFLVRVLNDLKTKNMNTVFLDYDRDNGFGKKENIDIWWNGKGRFLSLALNLLKFLQTSPEWRDSNVRLLIINSNSSIHDKIFRETSALLSEKRIKANIKILSDDFGSRTVEDIIHSESNAADLLMLGISTNIVTLSKEYIDKINRIIQLPSSTLLLRPSHEFEELNLIDKKVVKVKFDESKAALISLPPFPSLENAVLGSRLEKLDHKLCAIGEQFLDTTFDASIEQLNFILDKIQDVSRQNVTVLKKEVQQHGKFEFQKAVTRNHQLYLRKMTSIVDVQNKEYLIEAEKILQNGISLLLSQIGNYVFESPETILISYFSDSKNKEKNVKYQYRKNLKYHIDKHVFFNLKALVENIEEETLSFLMNIRMSIMGINDSYQKLTLVNHIDKNNLFEDIDCQIEKIGQITQKLNDLKCDSRNTLMVAFREVTLGLVKDTKDIEGVVQSTKKKKEKSAVGVELLKSFSEDWGRGVRLINNTLLLDMNTLMQKDIADNILTAGNDKIYNHVADIILKPAQEVLDTIDQLLENKNDDVKLPEFEKKIELIKIVNELIQKVIGNIEKLPEEVYVPELMYIDSEPVQFMAYTERLVYPNKMAANYIDTLFREPFYRDVERLNKVVNDAIIEFKEACSLLVFHMNNIDNEEIISLPKDKLDKVFYKKILSQVEEEKKKIELELNNISSKSINYLHNSFSKLFYHAIIGKEKGDKIEQRKSKKFVSNIVGQIRKVKENINNGIIYLINSTNSSLLISKKYIEEKEISELSNSQLLDFIEDISPVKNIYNTVPVFYRNLMSSSSTINNDFWIPREREMKIIKEALSRHKHGIGGALMIKGVHGAGKTTLSRQVMRVLFKKNNGFWIDPPVCGSTDPNDLLKAFQKEIAYLSDFDAICRNMPYESAIVINNLDLWWERRPGGGAVILKLIELIKEYGERIFFVLNCESNSFNIIKNIYPILSHSLALVECEAFNSKELQHLILSRHKSSGIALSYQDKTEDAISQLKFSLLFNQYFYLSGGIPGIAMNIWKANIVKYEKDTITIRKPAKYSADNLCYLQKEWLLVISLVIQHKHMDLNKLVRLTNYKIEVANNLLQGMKNAGLIVEKESQVYILDRNIEPYLVYCSKTFGLI